MSKPKEPDLFAWAPKNPGKVLQPGSPIFSPETAVPETQKAVADKAVAAVTTVRPVSTPRPVVESPLADASDGVVQFLERLADEYDGESKIVDAQLARAITVHKDYIVIGGYKLTRNNELI